MSSLAVSRTSPLPFPMSLVLLPPQLCVLSDLADEGENREGVVAGEARGLRVHF